MDRARLTRNEFLKLAVASSIATLSLSVSKFKSVQDIYAEGLSGFDPALALGKIESRGSKPFDWYVDSVSGDDSNSGKSSKQAFRTISRLAEEIGEGDIVGLAKGSHWHEQLLISKNDVQIRSFGTGEKPLLDCSELIDNDSFTKTDGHKNIYQTNVTIDGLSGSVSFVSVWENDRRLIRSANLEECDAIKGSYYPSADSGAITLCVHSFDQTDPGVNKNKYEYSKRHTGINTYDAVGCTIVGIQCRRNAAQDGSIRAGRFSRIFHCLVSEGNYHNILVRTGSYCYKVDAVDAYHTQGQAMFVYNENSPNNETVTFRRCRAINSTFNQLSVGFYGHQNLSGTFGNVYYIECIAHNVAVGFSGVHANIYEIDCQTTGKIGESRRIHTPYYSVSGSIDKPEYMVRAITILDGAETIIVDNWKATGTSPNVGLIWGNVKKIKLSLTHSSLSAINDGQSSLIWLTGTGCELYSHNNTFSVPQYNFYYNLPNDIKLDSNDNRFNKPEQSMIFSGQVFSLSEYKIIFRQDRISH